MANEKNIIKGFMNLFKAKTGEEPTASDVENITDVVLNNITSTTSSVEVPTVNHNAAVVKQLQDAIAKITAEFEAKQAERDLKAEQTIKDLQDYAAKQKEEADKRQSVIEAQLENDKKVKIDTLIAEAVKVGRLEPQNVEKQEKIIAYAKTDFDGAKALIDSLPIISNVQNVNQTQTTQTGGNKFVAPMRGFGSGIDATLLKETQELIENNK